MLFQHSDLGINLTRGQSVLKNRKFTSKQTSFIDNYLTNGGNGVQAAKSAGYKGTNKTLSVVATENLAKPSIKELIDAELNKITQNLRATAEDKRRALWEIANEGMEDVTDKNGVTRMKNCRATIAAIAELNKMDGDYADKKQPEDRVVKLYFDADDEKLL